MNDHLFPPCSWAPFGSVITDQKRDCSITVGRCCSRHGVVYRWTFTDGAYACGVYVDDYLIRETGVLVRMYK